MLVASALLVVVLMLLFEERTRKELEGRNFEGLGMKEERKEGPGTSKFEGSGLGRKRGRKEGTQAQAFTRC